MQRQNASDLASSIPANAPLLLDFDHTLLCSNSTELFISECKPSFVIAIIDFVVRKCIPWRLSGLNNWFRVRDYVCCMVIFLLTPWNLWRWKTIAPDIFAAHVSKDVSAALDHFPAKRTTIISFGMKSIISPMIALSKWRATDLIATPNRVNIQYFKKGKRDIAEDHLTAQTIAEAAFVTDSLDDQDLLEVVSEGILIEPQGEPASASETLYLPLRYTANAKYSRNYIIDQTFLVDILLAIISVSMFLEQAVLYTITVPFFILSLMCIYEIGYFENDVIGAKKEKSPTLKPSFEKYRDFPVGRNAWMWGVSTGLIGCVLGAQLGLIPDGKLTVSILIWGGLLLLTRGIFYIYNRLGSAWRTLFYPLLQIIKSGAIFLIFVPSVFGVLMTFSQVVAMSANYTAYRLGLGRDIIEKEVTRLGVFIVGASILVAIRGWELILDEYFAFTILLLWASLRLAKPALRKLRQS
ncbi:MAG: hypothetical protein AAF719_02840 [Pseudomonadota bacterium]